MTSQTPQQQEIVATQHPSAPQSIAASSKTDGDTRQHAKANIGVHLMTSNGSQ